MEKRLQRSRVNAELCNLRKLELRLARRNPYDNANTARFLIKAFETQGEILTICRGSRPRAKRFVDAWFIENPFNRSEGRGPKAATARSKLLFASILAATSRAPRRLQSRWSRAFLFIDYEHGMDLSRPKLEWILEDKGGLRKLASHAARIMPTKKRRAFRYRPLLD